MSGALVEQELWNAVDAYITERLVSQDAILDGVLQRSAAAGLPAINVAPNQGKFLMLLAKLQGARQILEIGTLGGYSTIWLARAVAPGGRVVTLEADARHAEVARANFARAGLAGVIELRLGPALETLPQLAAEDRGPLDLTFIDADKPNTTDYFKWALKMSRPGSVIIADNVVRKGALADANSGDANVEGMRRLHDYIAAEPRVSATSLQTVGVKGYDGFSLAVVLQ
jgi:predicted O-methyltransferase YrrM